MVIWEMSDENYRLIPMLSIIDPFHGSKSVRRAGAARCGTSGKRRNAPGGPMCPTRKGRALFAASQEHVAPQCGTLQATRGDAGGKKRRGEVGQYY